MRLALCDELTNGNGDKVRRVVIPWAWHLNGDLVLTGGSRNETCVGGGGSYQSEQREMCRHPPHPLYLAPLLLQHPLCYAACLLLHVGDISLAV